LAVGGLRVSGWHLFGVAGGMFLWGEALLALGLAVGICKRRL
jgi:hypothetical protein